MQQYFIDEIVENQKQIHFNEEQSFHMQKVLRMKENSEVKVVDKDGNPFMCAIQMNGKKVVGNILNALDKVEEKVTITLIQGMIKKEKWDFLIQKTCELGVRKIIPMISSRTIVKVDSKDVKKIERYNKIALEACEQCKRDTLARVENPITFKDIIHYKSELNMIAYEDADFTASQMKYTLAKYPDVKSITIVIGSEGGFSQEEVEYLVSNDFICVSLGKRILRAETAAIASISSIQYEYE